MMKVILVLLSLVLLVGCQSRKDKAIEVTRGFIEACTGTLKSTVIVDMWGESISISCEWREEKN